MSIKAIPTISAILIKAKCVFCKKMFFFPRKLSQKLKIKKKLLFQLWQQDPPVSPRAGFTQAKYLSGAAGISTVIEFFIHEIFIHDLYWCRGRDFCILDLYGASAKSGLAARKPADARERPSHTYAIQLTETSD